MTEVHLLEGVPFDLFSQTLYGLGRSVTHVSEMPSDDLIGPVLWYDRACEPQTVSLDR